MNEQDINDQAIQALNEAESQTNLAVRSRLTQARQNALNTSKANAEGNRLGIMSTWLLGSGAFASLVLALFLVNTNFDTKAPELSTPEIASSTSQPAEIESEDNQLSDLVLLASMDSVEFEVASDLEFNYWLTKELDDEPNTVNSKPAAQHNG